jgi:tripartite-type tricarboxylate transporter receptor subunit TctC
MSQQTLTFRRVTTAAAAAVALIASATACGGSSGDPADYPNDNITFIVPYDPGGASDLIGRQWAKLMSEELGVNIAVRNNGGGKGTIGTSEILSADPDGYTLGYGHNSPLAIEVEVNDDLPYSGPEDYTPLGMIGSQPTALAVRSEAPWKTFEEFVEAAREAPGERTIAVGGTGDTKDLQMRSVQEALDVKFNSTPFSGGGSEAVTAVLGGQVDSVAVSPTALTGLIEAGKLRPLAVFSDGELTAFETAVYGEDDIPGMTLLQDVLGIVAPAGLPEEIQVKILEAHKVVMQDESMLALLADSGTVVSGITGEEFGKKLADSTEVFLEVVG